MSSVLYFLLALLILSLIVFAHELGHYLAARASGIRVLEFAIGFGPKLFGWRRKEIDYSVRALPMGGYCKFEGEDDSSDDPRAFSNAPVWKRFLTILSGPAMNFLLAHLVVALFLMFAGVAYTVPVVYEVASGMPADGSLQAGDVITAVDGEPIELSESGAAKLVRLIGQRAGEAVTLTVDRGGEAVTVVISPQDTESGGRIGITLGSRIYRFGPISALAVSGERIVDITRAMLDSFKGLITRGEGLEDTMGPVGIISFMTQEIRRDFEMVVNLIVIISLNLGILNLLPLPALDGGRLVFLALEAVRRKPIKPEYEGWVHMAGFVFLIGVIVVFTYRDIVRLIAQLTSGA